MALSEISEIAQCIALFIMALRVLARGLGLGFRV